MIIIVIRKGISWEVIMDIFEGLFRSESSAEMLRDSLLQTGSRILCRKRDSGLCALLFCF